MYQTILSRRYFLRKVIPQLAMLSVALCAAMVIIVFSVMGGFQKMVLEAGRKLIGDVAIERRVTGFGHYEEMLTEIRALPEVAAATPLVETLGLLKLFGGEEEPIDLQPENKPVTVLGVRGNSYHEVNGFADSLIWRPYPPEEAAKFDPRDIRHPDFAIPGADAAGKERLMEGLWDLGQNLGEPGAEEGIVPGINVSPYNQWIGRGSYEVRYHWMPNGGEVTLTVLPIDDSGGILDAATRTLPVLNEFAVMRYDVDSAYVLVPFDMLQRMLELHERERLTDVPERDAQGNILRDEFGDPIYQRVRQPGRCTKIVVKAADGVTPDELKPLLRDVYDRFHQRYPLDVPPATSYTVRTWEDQIQHFVAQVRKETALMMTLFSIISLVSIFLVLSIFWTIVQQKTRDIGILRSLGASRPGIAWLFIRYGLVLGVVGSLLGGGLAHLIVWNINPIHEFIGRVTGTYIWSPESYYFFELPNEVSPISAAVVMGCGMLFAVVGAIIPAVRAAWVDPVTALRYE